MSPRKTSVLFLASVLLTAATVAFLHAPSVYAEEATDKPTQGPCSTNPFKFRQVEQACKAGGRAKAGAFMEATVNKARKKGLKIDDATIKCKSCHVNLKAYRLLSNAVDDLHTLLDE
jgi:hypothetical protein